MKPFSGIDITTDKDNEVYNGDEFIVARPSLENQKTLEKATDDSIELIDKAFRPSLRLRIPLYITGVLSLLGIITLDTAFEVISEDPDPNVNLAFFFSKVPWLFFLIGAVIITFIVLLVITVRKSKAILNSDENESVENVMDAAISRIFEEFGVPDDAVWADLLSFSYVMKNGEPVIKKSKDDISDCLNIEYKVYVRDGCLYAVTSEGKYAFPLDSLVAIRKIEKKLSMFGWNKDIEHNKGVYKQYKMKNDDYSNVIIRYYYVLESQAYGQNWGIYFPPYELELIERLTGLKAE